MAEEYISRGKDDENEMLVDFDLGKMLMVVRRSIVWIILIFALCISAVYLYLYYQVPIYQSGASLKLEMKGTSSLLGLGIFKNNDETTRYLYSEIEIIKSNLIYEQVIRNLKLETACFSEGNINDFEMYHNSPFRVEGLLKNAGMYNNQKFYVSLLNQKEYKLSYEKDGKTFSQNYFFGEQVSTPELQIQVHKTNHFDENAFIGKFYFKFFSDAYIKNDLIQNLQVNILNAGALTLGVYYNSPNPFKAKEIVNAVDSAYLKQSVDAKNRVYTQTRQYLEIQLDCVRVQLERAEKALEDYKNNRGANQFVSQNLDEVLRKMREAESQKYNMNTELRTYDEVVKFMQTDSSFILTSAIASRLTDRSIALLLRELYNSKNEVERILQTHKEPTNAYRMRQQAFLKKEQELIRLINFNRGNIYKEIFKIDSVIRSQEIRIPTETNLDLEYRRLNRYYSGYEKNYDVILERIVETGIAESGTVPNFQILESASLPEVPIYPVGTTFYTSSAAFAAALSILLIIVRYLMLNKIMNLKELEKLVNAPILGAIPQYTRSKMSHSQLVINKNPKSSISESFRSVRTNLDFMIQSGKKRIFSVTSTISGEGKTFIAVNLAGIIALSDSKVIVLDLDLRKPKLHFAFGAENTLGMSTILIGKSSVEECIRKSEIENLHFITSGPQPPNPAELLLSEEFEKLITHLHEIYDVVVFDTPPIGIVTDGMAAMRKADVPIYVARAGYSHRIYTRNINKLIAENNFRKLSIILNGAGSKGTYGYGYGYGYGGYGYGYGYGSYGYRSGYYEDTPKENLFVRFKNKLATIFKRNT